MAIESIALFASFSGTGGVERMLVHLIQGFLEQERSVELLLVRQDSPYLAQLPKAVRRIPLGTQHTWPAVPPLAAYLRQRQPRVLLAVKDRAGRAALFARRLAGTNTPIVLRLGTHLSTAMAQRSRIERRLRYGAIRRTYPKLNRIIAVSQGVAADTAAIAGLPLEAIAVIPNPVITPNLYRRAAEPCFHPWFRPGGPPVILGAGRLQRQKDFGTLIRAFARVRQKRPCRLVILGEGGERPKLETLVRELGLSNQVDLPGFQENPYPFFAAARLFVLSSAWEGSPNVLTEAMALGTPVVATNCPSGPAELLAGGQLAPLVAVGDVVNLARAMEHTLAHPPSPEKLQRGVAAYNQTESTRRYLEVLESVAIP